MIEIISQGKSLSEAHLKCTVAKILLTDLLPAEKISADTTVKLLNAIGGISIVESADKE
jgi:hypothetical protein